MTLDLNKYRINIKPIAHQLNNKTQQERYDAIGSVAVATGVPIIAVATYVGELYGFSIQLYAFIERLKKFYHITEILGAKT